MFQRLGYRYPETGAEGRLAEALDAIYDLNWENKETTKNYVSRTLQVLSKAQQEGTTYPKEAHGHALLRGAQHEMTEQAAVFAMSQRSWKISKLPAALRATYRVRPKHPSRAHVVEEEAGDQAELEETLEEAEVQALLMQRDGEEGLEEKTLEESETMGVPATRSKTFGYWKELRA